MSASLVLPKIPFPREMRPTCTLPLSDANRLWRLPPLSETRLPLPPLPPGCDRLDRPPDHTSPAAAPSLTSTARADGNPDLRLTCIATFTRHLVKTRLTVSSLKETRRCGSFLDSNLLTFTQSSKQPLQFRDGSRESTRWQAGERVGQIRKGKRELIKWRWSREGGNRPEGRRGVGGAGTIGIGAPIPGFPVSAHRASDCGSGQSLRTAMERNGGGRIRAVTKLA